MRNRAKSAEAKQTNAGWWLPVEQLTLPMIEGIARSKESLLEWVHQVGLSALRELFEHDAERIAGPKGKHSTERSHYRWGSAPAELPFGGRRIVVRRPRVRSRSGQEARLATVEHFQRIDAVPARVLNQILLGVSTRGYAHSLEPVPAGVMARGTSKSAASRHLIARMSDKLREQLNRRLDAFDLLVLMLDGVVIARRTVVVALGILADGRKVVLGLWQGSTENAALCTALLQNLLERGLTVDGRTLCVIDGGRGIRKALEDVFGDLAVVQRCAVHKQRNVLDHLPQSRKAHVARALAEAWASASAELARRRLKTLLQWLERNGESGAAASLREGMEETLTVLKLGLPPALRSFLVTTNAIENLIGSSRRICRNVTRWRAGDMISRWAAVGLLQAEQHFRRVRGYRYLSLLKRALRGNSSKLDATEKAA
ncbi:MAG TPA: IS256 family transposase [Burkholderiaceae bacterium]